MRYNLVTAAAVAALTFGISEPRIAPGEAEPPLSDSYIVIAADDTATDDDAESVKMGEESGDQSGDDETMEVETKKVDQPDRDDDGEMDGDAMDDGAMDGDTPQ